MRGNGKQTKNQVTVSILGRTVLSIVAAGLLEDAMVLEKWSGQMEVPIEANGLTTEDLTVEKVMKARKSCTTSITQRMMRSGNESMENSLSKLRRACGMRKAEEAATIIVSSYYSFRFGWPRIANKKLSDRTRDEIKGWCQRR